MIEENRNIKKSRKQNLDFFSKTIIMAITKILNKGSILAIEVAKKAKSKKKQKKLNFL